MQEWEIEEVEGIAVGSDCCWEMLAFDFVPKDGGRNYAGLPIDVQDWISERVTEKLSVGEKVGVVWKNVYILRKVEK